MPEGTPRISIGLPVFNGADHIREAIGSVLTQTFADFELIISDNASTDGTGKIVRSLAAGDRRIRYQRVEENRGAAWNFNHVFALSRGEYFKWFAHDDVLAPKYLERCVAVMDDSPDSVVLCFPDRIVMTHEGTVIGKDMAVRWFEAAPPYDRIGFIRSLFIPDRRFPELVFGVTRRDALRRTGAIGAFNLADLVLVTELRLLGEFYGLGEPLFFNRLHRETGTFQRERRTVRGEAGWYHPEHRKKILWPRSRIAWERLKAIFHSEKTVAEKLWFASGVIVAHVVTGIGRSVARPIARMHGSFWGMWETLTRRAAHRSGGQYVARRLWVLLSGVRHGDWERVRCAVATPSRKTEARLQDFVDEGLSRRRSRDQRTTGGERDR